MSSEVFSARRVQTVEPGSPQWLQSISASKIAALLGISPYESRFSLYHRMKGAVSVSPGNAATSAGNYLEESVARWWADQHPEYVMRKGGSWARKDNPAHTCSPDRMPYNPDTRHWLPLEIKTARNDWEWGREGTAEIPPYYLAQVIWQMHVLGVDEIAVAVLTTNFTFKEYRVTRADIEMELGIILEAVEQYTADFEAGIEPDINEHGETYVALRELHPEIDGEKVVVDDDLAEEYATAKQAVKDSKEAEQLAVNKMMAAMGTAERAVTESGQAVASRRISGGKPSLNMARTLTPKKPKTIQGALSAA